MNQYEERASELQKRKKKIRKKIEKLRDEHDKINVKLVDLHRQTLDDPNAEELSSDILHRVVVAPWRSRFSSGHLIESRGYHGDLHSKYALFDAEENCKHQIVALDSGVACTRCPGWYCA